MYYSLHFVMIVEVNVEAMVPDDFVLKLLAAS